ncbi:MAG: hypothetical protein K0R25_7 [Rickettsiaceae bacterium]|nr:hypothetical protein [Rickettsiaceae bacterium]
MGGQPPRAITSLVSTMKMVPFSNMMEFLESSEAAELAFTNKGDRKAIYDLLNFLTDWGKIDSIETLEYLVTHTSNIRKLKSLDLSLLASKFLPIDKLRQLLADQIFPHLTELNIDGCQNMPGEVIVMLSKAASNIAIFNAREVEITDENLKCFTNLEELNMPQHLVIRIGGTARKENLTNTLQANKKLRKLNVLGTDFTGEGLEYCANLEELNVENCPNLTEENLALLLQANPENLKKLNLRYTYITGECLKEPRNWKELNIDGCSNMSKETMDEIYKANPGLKEKKSWTRRVKTQQEESKDKECSIS